MEDRFSAPRRGASLRDGFTATVPAAISAGAYGIILGALAAERAITTGVLWLQNTVLFAGAAQFVMVGSWGAPLPVAPIVLAVLAVNLRYILITATLRPIFLGAPRWQRFAFIHLVADENWAVTMARHRKAGTNPWFLFGAGLCIWTFWMAGTTLGHQLGALIHDPERYALDFAFAAVFISLAVSFWRGKHDLLPWLAAAVAAVLVGFWIDGNWHVIVGGVVGASLAAILPERETGS